MNWVKLENKLIRKDDVSALEYAPPEGPVIANLTIHLRGGSQIKLTRDEAIKIWEIFSEDTE